MDELTVSIESSRNVIDDHNWNRKKLRFCVQKTRIKEKSWKKYQSILILRKSNP